MADGAASLPPLPQDAGAAALAARIWRPDIGPCVAATRDGDVVDISATFATMRDLCESKDPACLLYTSDAADE